MERNDTQEIFTKLPMGGWLASQHSLLTEYYALDVYLFMFYTDFLKDNELTRAG